jgi:hypothetical protein
MVVIGDIPIEGDRPMLEDILSKMIPIGHIIGADRCGIQPQF